MLFLANRDRYTQRTLHREIHTRLTKRDGCENVRYRPSRRRPRYVLADVDPSIFFGETHEISQARLEIRFWYPTGVEYEYYRLNWVEPERNLMLGFHQDGDHGNLGPCHIQLDYEDEPIDRHEAEFLDAHPLAVLDERLRQLPTALDSVSWEGAQPSLPAWSASAE